jgi:hypothetical protein
MFFFSLIGLLSAKFLKGINVYLFIFKHFQITKDIYIFYFAKESISLCQMKRDKVKFRIIKKRKRKKKAVIDQKRNKLNYLFRRVEEKREKTKTSQKSQFCVLFCCYNLIFLHENKKIFIDPVLFSKCQL